MSYIKSVSIEIIHLSYLSLCSLRPLRLKIPIQLETISIPNRDLG